MKKQFQLDYFILRTMGYIMFCAAEGTSSLNVEHLDESTLYIL